MLPRIAKSGRFRLPKLSLRCYSNTDTEFKELHPLLLKRAEKYVEELQKLEEWMAKGGGSFDVERQKKFSKLSAVVDSFRIYSREVSTFKELQDMVKDDPS